MVSAISSGMSAASISQMQERMFKKMDANSDGKVDKDEMTSVQANGPKNGPPAGAPGIEEIFSESDTDGDGALTMLEMEAGLSKLGQEMREKGLQSQSATGESDGVFTQMDADGDGKVTQEEMAQFHVQGPGGGPPSNGPPPVGPPPGEGLSAEEMFTQLDTDQDGSISESEFSSGMKNRIAAGSFSTLAATATGDSDTNISKILSQAINGYRNSYSGSYSTESPFGTLWSSYT